jgi:hypothetical protein
MLGAGDDDDDVIMIVMITPKVLVDGDIACGVWLVPPLSLALLFCSKILLSDLSLPIKTTGEIEKAAQPSSTVLIIKSLSSDDSQAKYPFLVVRSSIEIHVEYTNTKQLC